MFVFCLDNSISSQITTPVTAQDLAAALISALESNPVSPVAAPNDVAFLILLAEDNLVNQKLAVGFWRNMVMLLRSQAQVCEVSYISSSYIYTF